MIRRVAVLQDYREENWPSMDLVGRQIVASVAANAAGWHPTAIQPEFRRRLSADNARRGRGFTADRLLNRMWDYPRHLQKIADEYDVFHLADHSYSQLLHVLPAQRTLVTLHDLDTFRCILRPTEERRGPAFRQMTKQIWAGLKKAGHIACVSSVVRNELLAAAPELEQRTSVVYNGAAAIFHFETSPEADSAVLKRLGPKLVGAIEILHVGSCITRKRIDLLLRIVAAVKATGTSVRLLRVGERLNPEQMSLALSLGLAEHLSEHENIHESELNALYRRADVVLLPSDREGFGLPMIEALAAGSTVVARDIPIFREIGGNLPRYFESEDILGARDAILATTSSCSPETVAQNRRQRILWARRFTWKQAATQWIALYDQLEMRRTCL